MSDVAIRSCRNDIHACSAEDQAAREALDRVTEQRGGKRAGPELTPNGEGYRAAKAQGRATTDAVNVAKKLAHHAPLFALEKDAAHLTDQLVKKFSHALGHATGILHATYEAVELYAGIVGHAKEHGRAENAGLQRDAMVLFTLAGAGRALSDAYKAHLGNQTTPESKKLAMRMAGLQTAALGAKAYDALMARYETSARRGVAEAQSRGLESTEALSRELRKDEKFRALYETSTSFRLGVDSAVYDATFDHANGQKAVP